MSRIGNCSVCLSALIAAQGAGAGEILFWNDFETAGCPAQRIMTTRLLYYAGFGSPTAYNVDMTNWDNLFGRSEPDGPIEPWPGQPAVSVVILDFVRTGYIGAHFTVPADGITYFGMLNHGTYYSGAGLTAAVSRWCGDFTHVEPHCRRDAGGGELLARWRTTASSGQCILGPGSYFLNIRLTDPTQQVSGCDTLICAENVQSNWDSN